MDTAESGDATRLARKRIRDRRAKQAARQRFLDECSALQSSIASLSASLAARQSARPSSAHLLSWREVASSLAKAKDKSVAAQHDLRLRVTQLRRLSQSLQTWLLSLAVIPKPPNSPAFAWKDVHLSSDAALRSVALDWIAKQMLHATPHQVPDALFPSDLEDAVHGATLLEAATAGWAFSQALPTIIHESRGGISTLHHSATSHGRFCYNREEFPSRVSNGLYTCFLEPDRAVTHYRTIRYDDASPIAASAAMLEDVQEWNVIRRVSPTKCFIRSAHVYQPYTHHASMVSYADEITPGLAESLAPKQGTELEDAIANRFVADTCSMMEGMGGMFRKLLRHVQANPDAYPRPYEVDRGAL
ncbi:hypothetical protein SPRG_14232 [Saprolegnia parasitica CBS 223.65]|uniref:BZIP domain-containing protein n=1 Tax=Saprolegnia parasitica (strain CBS 223.65) TaxID=695850 RepID=A0A067BSD3_SAPPC|nr:hypothetical protein SPRG_14232 [Saprolegnia parasitica CBS 223.65]KDO19705.1 hypothetical protein SPRG_14232 [Saprolegnia parasitica CBS 223.65]|eukprot:XP_012209565.1 hypothetical protein SPRG_14232 [Saprolegnia parasitica CBS 223.65]